MTRKHLQELIKSLQEIYRCPSCETNYYFDDIKFLGQIDQYCFVQLTCHSCTLPLVATVSSDGKAATGHKRRTATELSKHEQSKFAGRGEITADEIAEFHRFLTSHKGPIGKLK